MDKVVSSAAEAVAERDCRALERAGDPPAGHLADGQRVNTVHGGLRRKPCAEAVAGELARVEHVILKSRANLYAHAARIR